MAIRVLVTGGTFDKEYDELTGSLYFQETHIAEMLKLGRCRVEVSVRTLMLVDPLAVNQTNNLIYNYHWTVSAELDRRSESTLRRALELAREK